MRKFILLFTILLFTKMAISQAPPFFNYQGVARNAAGTALINKTIKLRLSIHEGGALGLVVYRETRTVTTNAFGLFSVQVGGAGATDVIGTLTGTDWKNGSKWMQVEMDPDGGNTLKDIGTTQLTSVPYSLYTSQSGDIVLPFNKSQNDENPLFRLINTGNNATSLAFEGLTNSTANNAAAVRGIISPAAPGLMSAGVVGHNNGTGGNGIGVMGTQNGTGWGVYGSTPGGVGVYGNSTTGMGLYGQSVSGPSIMGYQPTTGTSNAAFFQNAGATNSATVLRVLSNGTGDGIAINMTGTGRAGAFTINNASSSATVLEASSNGLGRIVRVENTSASNSANILEVVSNGTNNVISSVTTGTGRAGFFQVNNATSASNAFGVVTNGTGYAANISSTNATPRALRTVGAIQFTGVSEAPGRVMATVDGSGTATWQNAASVGLVSGSGTTNFITRWTPDGTFIGNSQIFDNGTNMSIAGPIDVNYKMNMTGNLRVNASVSDSAVAVFENTNSGANSDGIIIKLGRTHPRWNGSAFANVPNPVTQGVETQVNQIRDWIYGNDSFDWTDLINLMPSQYLVGTVCNLTNLITTNINSGLGLPINISGPINNALNLPVNISGPINSALGLPINLSQPINDGLGLPYEILGETVIPALPALTIPQIPAFSIPAMPNFSIPAIPQINCAGLPTLSFPVFVFNDVNNSLSNTNEFVTFIDKDNRKLGTIRAVSIQNFSYNYFDGQKLLDLCAEFIGIDIVDDFMSIISGTSQMVKDYNEIGVEYNSGNGDYAEWLERMDPDETISFGDIVAVKGGKITKNIIGAEQIMAVSKNPIVLGNVPDATKVKFGNNIAFMGQIPVKVMGAVTAGDYIIAQSDIAGYGTAVHPKDMTVEAYKLVVGRSWDTNERSGPKMVNTVVGVHNHDFLNIIGQLQQRTSESENRLKVIEEKLNIGTDATSQPAKKAF